MGTLVGLSAATLLTGLIFYNAFVSYRWNQDHRRDELLSESSHWHGSLLYANGNDPRLFVPKRSGGGYTINFGKPFSILLILLFSILIFISF